MSEISKMITVKFLIDDGNVFTQSYSEALSIEEVKESLAKVFLVPTKNIDLLFEGSSVSNEEKLNEFALKPYGTLELNLVSTDEEYPILAENAYRDFAEPDIITVRIDGYRDVTVEIEDRKIEKPFIGGYINKNTLTEYYDAYSQTGPPKPKVPPEMKNHRDTQTYFIRNRKTKTPCAHATQMTTTETWIPNVTDKILIAGPYETADEREARIALEEKVRTIQRYYRAWKIRKALRLLSDEYKRRIAQQLELNLLYEKQSDEQKRKELIFKIFPLTKADFVTVQGRIDRWKRMEIRRINALHCGPARIAELYLLLDKEVQVIRALDAHKQKLRHDVKVQKDQQFFHEIGNPIEWNSSYKNILVQMDTLETQKGREYRDLYMDVCKSKPNEDHLETLLKIKLYLKDHSCEITTDLNRLIDRACELIVNGISDRHLDVLQKRIEALLIHHFKTPECSEVVTYTTRRREKLMENNLFYCHHCHKYKTLSGFNLQTKAKKLKVCAACLSHDKRETPQLNMSPYRYMLRQLRKDERMRQATASYAFLMQENDMFHLVTRIWKRRSVISDTDDIYQLQMCRWFIDDNWAPWNCILLTREEAKEHLKIKDLKEVYDNSILSCVYIRHAIAKKHFQVVFKLNEKYQEMGEHDTKWNEILDIKQYVRVNDDDDDYNYE